MKNETPRTKNFKASHKWKSPSKKEWQGHAEALESDLIGANDMLERINGICDEVGIAKTDGDIPSLEIQFCEGHRVKLMAEKLKRMAARLAAGSNEKLSV